MMQQISGQMDLNHRRQIDGKTGIPEWMDGSESANRQMDWMHGWEKIPEWMDGSESQQTDGWTGWMKKLIPEWMDEWI